MVIFRLHLDPTQAFTVSLPKLRLDSLSIPLDTFPALRGCTTYRIFEVKLFGVAEALKRTELPGEKLNPLVICFSFTLLRMGLDLFLGTLRLADVFRFTLDCLTSVLTFFD